MLEVDLKRWQSRKHRTLLSVKSDARVTSNAYWVFLCTRAGCVDTSDTLQRVIKCADTRYCSRVVCKVFVQCVHQTLAAFDVYPPDASDGCF